MNYRFFIVSFLSVLITACTSRRPVASTASFVTSAYKDYKIDSTIKADNTIETFLIPYTTGVNKQMNVVIGNTETPLERKTPEGTLGNFVADAMLQRAIVSYKKNVDASFVNDGGLRIDNIAPGPIVLGKMYELMPFDNVVVLMEVTGKQLHDILDIIALKKGWPISGIKMKIANNRATNILINGRSLQNEKIYTIATTDYTAKGNEGFEILKTFEQQNNGYLFRDALIDYVKDMSNKGRSISAQIENRITNAE